MAQTGVILIEKWLLVFGCFADKMVLFGVVSGLLKNKAINFSFQDYFKRYMCNF